MIWHCVVCPDEEPPTYGPALNTHCTVMNGPAAVRMGYAQEPPSSPQPVPEPPFME